MSTVDHSDFSHGVPGDFALRLIRPGTRPRRAGPYETSRGYACSFSTVPPAHTLLRPGVPSTSFAPIVRARHHLDLADRFAVLLLDYGPVVRRKPFRPRLAAGALSCAFVPMDHFVSLVLLRPARHYPRLLATDPAWGRSDWTFTSKLSAPPGAHYDLC